MVTNLRILLLEDSLADAALIERELVRDGFSFTLVRVQTEADLRRELAQSPPHLILSNHLLPGLGGFEALAIVLEVSPWIPFIFVSGSNDQQLVFDMFEEGASDYVFKRDLQDLRLAISKACGIDPEPVAAAPVPDPRQPELLPPLIITACGYLSLCPHCHQARDEAGQIVPMQDYCFHRLESLVIRKLCEDCSRILANEGAAKTPAAGGLHPLLR